MRSSDPATENRGGPLSLIGKRHVARRGSRVEYEKRLHHVLLHIDRHLDKTLDLDVLAAVALFSPYHCHRLYSAWMGETLGDYLRRRRLEVAAIRLAARPHLPVLEVSQSVGFGSAEAFSRAFKARFKCSPTSWRSQQAGAREINGDPELVKPAI